jgi:phosphoglycerate dehydrogenase-like enzyme
MTKFKFVCAGLVRPLIEPHLPDWVEPHWFMSKDEALTLAPLAEIGWFDMYEADDMVPVIQAATNLKWLNSVYSGIDWMPMETLLARDVTVTNGAGINAITIAEYVVMGMLNIAKGYRGVVRAQDRHEWLQFPPGRRELSGSKALLLGYGAIGKMIETRLLAFGVDVVPVRRTSGQGTLGPDEWREKLGEFDWVIVALPATPETEGMIGANELAAMKSDAVLVNIARGSVIDQDALVAALSAKQIGGSFLDVTTPEPLPPEHPLWDFDNVHISMHLSGQSQDKMYIRSAKRFLENLARFERGEKLVPQVNLKLGY